MSSEITLRLSAAQASRLRNLARLLKIEPDQLAIVSLFNSFDSFGGEASAATFREVWPSMVSVYSDGRAIDVGRDEVSLDAGLAAADALKKVRRRSSKAKSTKVESPLPSSARGVGGASNTTQPAGRVFSRDDAIRYTGHPTLRAFYRWCREWELESDEGGRFAQASLDAVLCPWICANRGEPSKGGDALIYEPWAGRKGIPDAECGPAVHLEGLHSQASMLAATALVYARARARGAKVGRAVFLTNSTDKKSLRAVAERHFLGWFAPSFNAFDAINAVEIIDLLDCSPSGIRAAAGPIARELRAFDRLVIFCDRAPLYPGTPPHDIPAAFISDVLDGMAGVLPKFEPWAKAFA